ncbi:MAG TPA: hypothetical protein VMD05_06370 [Candidatus Nanoarchaeia archaeon]|nr:hypothetical protein [Candidatus Nanoarchaeia archaeon]
MALSSNSQSRKSSAFNLAFLIVYIVAGVVLIYLRFTNAISTNIFGIGIFVVIIGSLIFKFVTDYLRTKK